MSEKKTAEKEDRYTGTVTWKVYFEYWKAGAGIPMLLVLVILVVGTQVKKGAWLIWQKMTRGLNRAMVCSRDIYTPRNVHVIYIPPPPSAKKKLINKSPTRRVHEDRFACIKLHIAEMLN